MFTQIFPFFFNRSNVHLLAIFFLISHSLLIPYSFISSLVLLFLTSKSLQSLLFTLFPDDEEKGHAQCDQNDRTANRKQLFHVIALTPCRLDWGNCAYGWKNRKILYLIHPYIG